MSRATGEGVRQSRGSTLVTMPSKSILNPPEASLERGKISQALIDISFALTVSISAVALGCALYLLIVVTP